jgi:hypothetical protein
MSDIERIVKFMSAGKMLEANVTLNPRDVEIVLSVLQAAEPRVLSLEELREMDGSPVYCDNFPTIEGMGTICERGWGIVNAENGFVEGKGWGSSFEWIEKNNIQCYTSPPKGDA